MKSALIIVDVQNDFLPSGALALNHGDEVIPVANRLMDRFAVVLATQDWHPADHGSFASNHAGKKIGDIVELNGLSQILWPEHCIQGTRGAELAAGLNQRRINKIFAKGTDPTIDSYSALYDNAHRKSTGLAEFLKRHGLTDTYILGLATDYCVKFTALDAVAEGFDVHVIEDGCRGVDLKPGDCQRAIEQMRGAGVQVVHSRDVATPEKSR